MISSILELQSKPQHILGSFLRVRSLTVGENANEPTITTRTASQPKEIAGMRIISFSILMSLLTQAITVRDLQVLSRYPRTRPETYPERSRASCITNFGRFAFSNFIAITYFLMS